jgi:hypothetical protein
MQAYAAALGMVCNRLQFCCIPVIILHIIQQCICGTFGNDTRMHAGEQKFESLQYKVAMAEVSHLHFAAVPHDDQAA